MPRGFHRIVWDANADIEAGYRTDSLAVTVLVGPYYDYPEYMVIDISGGPTVASYPISYLEKIPEGGWTEEHRSSKIVFKLIQPGTFIEGPDDNYSGHLDFSRKCTLTRPYYFGIFRITEKQWNLIMGDQRYMADRAECTAVNINVHHIRGYNHAIMWPESDKVDEGSFVDIVRRKTGCSFDMPTEAQWEYAARAGSTSNDAPLNPNAWGLYEFGVSDNCQGEWCIDWWSFFTSSDPVVDPKGPMVQNDRDRPAVVRCSEKSRYNGHSGVNLRSMQLTWLSALGRPYTGEELGFRLQLTK